MDTKHGDLMREAVHWLARLPFLGVIEMAMLLRIDEIRTQIVLSELEGLGWCEWIVPTSPELDERRLYILTSVAQDRLVRSGPANSLPLRQRETLARLPRLETTAGLNRFISELVAAVAQDIEVDLADARSLPWTTPRSRRYWPPEVEGYVCLRWGPWVAPFFIAWDRAGAPEIHRRKRVAGWYTYTEDRGWQTAPIFVISPGERAVSQWSRSVIKSAERRGCPLLTVLLATGSDALTEPIGGIWRRVDRSAKAYLFEMLTKLPPDKAPMSPLAFPVVDLEPMSNNDEPLRKWAPRVADCADGMSGSDRLAARSLATGSLEKTALEWVAHHTLLTSDDIATLMDVPVPLAEKLGSSLERLELITSLSRLGIGQSEADRYLLTSLGLRLIAARDGVPPRRYVRHGVVAGPDPGQTSQRLDTLVSQFEHTVGTNSFFVRLTRDLRARGGRLLSWLNASESAECFTYRGQRRWLRPDGYAEFELNGEAHRIFLEWDRGTNRHTAHLRAKLGHYAEYMAARSHDELPDLLIVTVSPQRERVMREGLRFAFGAEPPPNVLTTVASLVERVGPLESAWRGNGDEGRHRWP